MEKWLKRIWFVNGILILFITLFSSYQLLYENLLAGFFYEYDEPSGTKVNSSSEFKGKSDSLLIFQDLDLNMPIRIINSDIIIYSVSPINLENPKTVYKSERMTISNEYQSKYRQNGFGAQNVIFYNIKTGKKTILLEKKGFISELDFSEQYSEIQDFIVYTISYEDSNFDGLINENDNYDFFVSNIDGSNFRMIKTEYGHLTHYTKDPKNKSIYFIGKSNKENKTDDFSIRYDYKTNEVIPVITKSTIDSLRKILWKSL